MRPVPIAPMLIRLLGAADPKTDAGTMAGNPAATDETAMPLPAALRNSRREALDLEVLAMCPLRKCAISVLQYSTRRARPGPGLSAPARSPGNNAPAASTPRSG